jgi:hypothetical protein
MWLIHVILANPRLLHQLLPDDFAYDQVRDFCLYPGGKKLTTTGSSGE